MDNEFLESTDHPMRQLLNRVALIHDATNDEEQARNDQIESLIQDVNRDFEHDVTVFEPLIRELDEVLRAQREQYQANVDAVVQHSVEQQQILDERRDKSVKGVDTLSGSQSLEPEWNRWLDRVRALTVGDQLIMNANTKAPFTVTLVWVGEDYNPYVFVDQKGNKASTLTLQQVAMYMRRGTLKMLDPDNASAVDRALFGMVNRMHEEVESKATQDEITSFLNRKTFLQIVERHLPNQPKKNAGPVLCQISIDGLKDINDRFGVEGGDEILGRVAETLGEVVKSKNVNFGRLSGTELGIFWRKGGIDSAQRKIQTCFQSFSELELERDGETIKPKMSAGMLGVDDSLTGPEELLSVVQEACNVARSTPDKPIHVAGTENKYKEKLRQMVTYIAKALDRDRLVFLIQRVSKVGDATEAPAAHVVISAEDRNGKIVPPSLFAQAMESSDRAFDVDLWTIKSALEWMGANEDILESYAAVIIPLSAAAAKRDDLSNIIMTELMQTTVPPGKIVFEITDKDVVANLTEVSDMIRTLKEFGCRFILDEFGSGQENYDYLKELAADFVTIQSTYVKDAKDNEKDFAMAKSINELAHFMGKKTIAKQVRGVDGAEIFAELGIDFLFDQTRSSRVEI